jgi:shikimate dehydrogenase
LANIFKNASHSLGLIGQHIGYSLSPQIHGVSAAFFGQELDYQLFDLPQGEIHEFLRDFWDAGGLGLNITQPHKSYVASLLKSEASDGVNCLYRGASYWQATSTDGQGFVRGLVHGHIDPNEVSQVVILGNGGVVPAIIAAIKDFKRLTSLRVLRRSDRRDIPLMAISSPLEVSFDDFSPKALQRSLAQGGHHTLLIQASSAPLRGEYLGDFAAVLNPFSGAVVDLVYGKPSQLLQRAKDMGMNCQDGLPMLIEQARLCQELWWGRSAPYQTISDHLARLQAKGTS